MSKVKNPIKSFKKKQNDKFVLELRLGKITILEISYDVSDKRFIFNLLSVLIVDTEKKKKKEN